MPKRLMNRVLLSAMAVVSLLITVDALLGGGTRQLILGLLCLAITGVSAPSLRRIEQKREQQ